MASPIKFAKIASTLPALLLTAAAYGQTPAGDGDYAVEHLGQVEDGYQDVQTEEGFVAEPVLSSIELQELVGRVALYPDDLLAIILPASTYPLEIVQAARFLEAFENDSTLEPDENWDESVVALLNYPEVLRILDDNIDWTWQLGDAVINQQDDLIGAIEGFRDRAYVAGNLKSDEFQKIRRDEGVIEIVPIEDDVIYVPYYEPEYVVTEQPQPVYHYYPGASFGLLLSVPYRALVLFRLLLGCNNGLPDRLGVKSPAYSSPDVLGPPLLRPQLLRPLLPSTEHFGLQHDVRAQYP